MQYDAEECRQIIDRCLEQGMSREEINDALDQHHNMKLVQKASRTRQTSNQRPAPSSGGSSGPASVAASRQARATGRRPGPAGPSNEEIIGVLHQHMTPPATPPPAGPVSLAEKRAKAREISEAKVGAFNADKFQAAYNQCHQDAMKAKSRNYSGSGIF